MVKRSLNAPGTKLTRVQRMSLWFFHRPRKTALVWLLIALIGVASYSTLLKREGFPSVATPFALAKGSYLVHNPAKVDRDVAKPINDFIIKQDKVKTVLTQSYSDFYTVIVNYDEGVDSDQKSKVISEKVKAAHILPSQATFDIQPYEFGFTERGDDMVVSFYNENNTSTTQELVTQAQKAAKFINDKKLPLVDNATVIVPYEKLPDPVTGQIITNQRSFDRYGKRLSDKNQFYNSVVVGVQAKSDADNLELDQQVRGAVEEYNNQLDSKGYHAEISASFAPGIKEQTNELQGSLLAGLLAVLVIGSVIIAVRASIITVLSMLTVLAATNAALYLIGYSLNTITMFALILGLSLIVDDTIIMVEALDSQRKKQKTADQAVSVATRKVSRAMIAATTTSVLSFAPLIFVGGILGSFIRAIPITIMVSLVVSLFVALIFIPLFARFLLLGKKQMGEKNVREVAAGFEAAIARTISAPMLWAKGSTKKLLLVGITALIIGFLFIGTGGYLFKKVKFNIFPPAKDGNQLSANITMPAGTDLDKAQAIADEVDKIVTSNLGSNFKQASYYGQADIKQAMLIIDLIDYKQRDITAPEMIKSLNNEFKKFKTADVEVGSLDAGPPAAAFTVLIKSSQDRDAALRLASDISDYLHNEAVLKRSDGTVAKIRNVSVGNSSIYYRKDKQAYVTVDVKYVDDDTTTLVELTKDAVNNKFTASKVATYGLPKDPISYDTGQEQENQDSFKTLAIAFPILLLVIYIVLSLQFRSMLQPILIYTALPFSLFGITLGLWLTDNAFSFFTMLGFFALIGLSIKNTILLTDYANQARAAGFGTVDAAHEALAERFRPLIATSLTAVVSLIPLTINSPFWEGIGVVLIFGLLSSTFLVITIFPYYYLGAEFLRQHVNRRTGISWFILTLALSKPLGKAALLAPIISAVLIKLVKISYLRARA